MIVNLYQEYLYVIGKLKDIYKLDVDVEHKNIHAFYKNKKPLFKLLYGVYQNDIEPSIVVTFHIEMYHPEVIQWFINIYSLYPLLRTHDSYIEDSSGETYLGQSAIDMQEVYRTQEILNTWLAEHDLDEIKTFAKSPVVGRHDKKKVFDSHQERDEAIIEFERLRKPDKGDGVH